jgi:hypothetical protein
VSWWALAVSRLRIFHPTAFAPTPGAPPVFRYITATSAVRFTISTTTSCTSAHEGPRPRRTRRGVHREGLIRALPDPGLAYRVKVDSNPRGRGEPPEDPEEWSDEQWLEWLKATDEPVDARQEELALPKRRSTRAQGALGAAMLGLRNAIYGRPDDDVVIVAEGSGDPPTDDHHVLYLDPEHPERSEVVLRPRTPPSPEED